jgi:hypothetical protein
LSATTFRKRDLVATWLDGALYVEQDGEGVLFDAPAHAYDRLDAMRALPKLRAIVLSGGRIQSVGGLVPLLCALEPHRGPEAPLLVWSPFGEERPALLADAWSRGWPDRYPLTIETGTPGQPFDAGPLEIRPEAIRRAEPRREGVEVYPAVALRISGQAEIAYVAGAGPGGIVRALCRGADLAIVEVGVKPWPVTEQRWRLTPMDAAEAVDSGELWLVGDDGRFVTGASA